MRYSIKKEFDKEKSVLIVEKSKNKKEDYSQMYYDGAISCIENFPIDDNIAVWNDYVSEKRAESKRHINSDYWNGVYDELEILSDIINNVLFNDLGD